MATPLICLKISPENVKQLSVKTSSAKRSSVSVEGSLTVRWSKKYLSAKSPSLFGITVQSNLSNTDTEGTEQSVRIGEVSVLERSRDYVTFKTALTV